MSATPNSNPRKRSAPGASPTSVPQMSYPSTSPEQMMRWNNTGNFMDNSGNNANPYGLMGSPSQNQFGLQSQAGGAPSTALARRGMGPNSGALIPANRVMPTQNDQWTSYGDDALVQPPNGPVDEHDDIDALEERALRAKKEAQTKRKQIPPFVQKLNSFLEDGKNTELIRWSEKGDSFIVLDEDEFAKTLIPELFKHNNYASFVRQLNMYGFHKKVGLSDNSMKASERKNKSPSEYYNPYFRKGHPNLLWLINKPKSNAKGRRNRADGGEADSDEEPAPEEATGQPYTQQTATPTRALPAPEGAGGPLQKRELAVVRNEMTALREQQHKIGEAIKRLREEHNQLYQQAMAFQEMHSRHENSINAILNFLANVFRKSLEEQGGVQNVNDLLASIIPNVQMPTGHSGSVFDLGDVNTFQQHPSNSASVTPQPRRQQRLLLGPNAQNGQQSVSPTPPPYNNAPHQPSIGTVTEVLDTPSTEAATPSYLKRELESNPQEGMMRIIQDANTNIGKHSIDLANVAANTATNMSNDRRNELLNIMSGAQNSAGTTPVAAPVSPTAPPASAGAEPQVSLSPIMSNPLPPSIQHMSHNTEELEQLQKLQEEQAQKLENLNSLLAPLSPSGRIPGLEDGAGTDYFNDNIDFGQYLDSNAFTGEQPTNDFQFDPNNYESTNFDWNNTDSNTDFGALGISGAPGVPGTHTGDATSPNQQSPSTSGTEEIPRDDFEDTGTRSSKRQRKA